LFESHKKGHSTAYFIDYLPLFVVLYLLVESSGVHCDEADLISLRSINKFYSRCGEKNSTRPPSKTNWNTSSNKSTSPGTLSPILLIKFDYHHRKF